MREEALHLAGKDLVRGLHRVSMALDSRAIAFLPAAGG
jgi:hypothetical protein